MLIPKVNAPCNISQFRPINPCNVMYKIIAKVVVNRFRKVLDKCIDDAQGVFVPRRQISDNIFIAYEVLHSFKKKKRWIDSSGSFALKLNMNKAFDRVE